MKIRLLSEIRTRPCRALVRATAWLLAFGVPTVVSVARGALPIEQPEATQDASDSQRTSRKSAERLIRESIRGDEEDVMDRLTRRMAEAADQLQLKFDTGPQTQALQQAILEDFEEAIETAAAQRRAMRRRPSDKKGDRRRMSGEDQRKASSEQQNEAGAPGQTASSTASAAESGGAAPNKKQADGELKELRQSWGHLPDRQRDEIMQGMQEDVVERYREWIERYYRALQEIDE